MDQRERELVTEHILTEDGESLGDLTPVLVELCTTVLRYGGLSAGPAVHGTREGATAPTGSGRAPTASPGGGSPPTPGA